MDIKRLVTKFPRDKVSAAAASLGRISDTLASFTPLDASVTPESVQSGFTNFYNDDALSPFIPTAGAGPWVANSAGHVQYDTGGYGMLGFGHNPEHVMAALSKNQVMANIMTPSLAQKTFWNKLRHELEPQYHSIVCLNSGSEANTHAMNIANRHHHPKPVRVSMVGSFHGRTEGPASVSGSSRAGYTKHLSDYSDKGRMTGSTYFVEPNNEEHVHQVFKEIAAKGEFPELTLFEPVMGEGNPGVPLERGFYDAMRECSANAGGLLLADSVQAGWRCFGELSVTRYPHMEGATPPDMESFSKAISGGQFPLSVLALSKDISIGYQTGLYGNTMTGNPRGLDVGSAVLEEMTPSVRENIRSKGLEFKGALEALAARYPQLCESVTGSGLLVALHLRPEAPVMPVERALRMRGLNVIHGGENALRFTPWFHLSTDEITLIVDIMDEYFEVLSRAGGMDELKQA
jgi:acetylornithine/succinyldiaminopimelate/putrescine aminotransferase